MRFELKCLQISPKSFLYFISILDERLQQKSIIHSTNAKLNEEKMRAILRSCRSRGKTNACEHFSNIVFDVIFKVKDKRKRIIVES